MKPSQETIVKDFSLNDFSQKEVITNAVAVAFELGMPMAMWRLPNQSEINLLISAEQAQKLKTVDLKELPSGFIFSKFNSEAEKYYLKGDITFSFDYQETISTGLDNERALPFRSKLQERLNQPAIQPPYFTNQFCEQEFKTDYRTLVQDAIEAIKQGHFEKVVPARSKTIDLSNQFDVIELFITLCAAYENAFVSFVSLPEEGTWVGASPEILIHTKGNQFTTVSLAGTKKQEEGRSISETSWNQKEIEEQAMVSRYIINCFKKIRLRDFDEKGPKTIKAGHLLHLKTVFKVDMEATNFTELPSVMLELLHPTSAVAGMPKKPAIDFLKRSEGLDRSFFAGYLGPVNLTGETNIFVNLRCMQLFKDKAILYAGAGVTEDSDPEKEFLETEMKCNTLLNKINHTI